MMNMFVPEADETNLSNVFQRYRKALARMVARIVKPNDIEDVVQETYVRIYQAAQKNEIRHPKSFMLKTARNIALNHVSRADAMNHLSTSLANGMDEHFDFDDELNMDDFDALPMLSDSPETLVQSEEEFQIFCRAVRDLPKQGRKVFVLKKVYGMSQREVARYLGIGEGTVEQHLAQSMVACGAYMRSHGYSRASTRNRARVNGQ